MAQHELLVKLGLQSDSFSRNIKNVNNQLKLTEAEFKKLESSTRNFGNTQKDLEAKLKSLKTTKEQLTAKTVLYKNKISELKGEIEQNVAKHDKLGKKLEQEQNKLRELASTHGKSSKAYRDQKKVVNELQSEYDKSQKKIENMNLSLQKHQQQLLKTETELNKLKRAIRDLDFQKATLHLDQFANKMIGLSGKLDSLSNKFTSLGRTMTAGITAPLVGAGLSISKFSAEFETSMDKVGALSRASAEDMQKLENKAREMGKATSFTAKEAADGLGYMALAGWNTSEMMAGLEPILRAAEASGKDLATTSDLVTDSMSTLGLSAQDLSGYLDMVARASSISNTEMDQMLKAYIQVGGSLRRFNVPLQESGALIGILANRGLKAEQAGRSLSSVMINLIKPTGESAKAMKELGVSAYDSQGKFKGVEAVLIELANELNKVENGTAKYTDKQKDMYLSMIGGKTQIRTLDALLAGVTETTENGATEFQNLKAELEGANGALMEMATKMKDNLQGDWERFTSMIGEAALTIGDLLTPMLRDLLQHLTEMVEKFISLDPETQKFILKAAAMAAAVGPVMLALGGLFKVLSVVTGGIGKTVKGFLSFGKTITDVVSAVAGGSSVWGALTATIAGLPAIVVAAGVALAGLAAIIGDNEAALAMLQDKWGTLGRVISGICEFISGVVRMTFGNLLIIISTAAKAIGALLKGKVWEIDDIIKEGNARIVTNTDKAWSDITLSTTRALDTIRNSSEQDMQRVNQVFEQALSDLPRVTKDNVEQVAAGFTEVFTSTNGKMLDLSDSTIEILKGTSDTMASLFDGIKGNMNIDEARVRFGYNMMQLLNSGKISATGLQTEFDRAGKLIANNLADSMKRATKETGQILSELGDIARDGLEPVADDITTIVEGMSQSTVDTIRGMGSNWSNIFKGISLNGSMTTQDMKKQILSNLEELGLSTPEKLQVFKEALVQEVDAAKKGAEQASQGTKEAIEQNVTPDGATTAGKTKQAMDQNTQAVVQGGVEATQAATEGGQNAGQAFNMAINTPYGTINLADEVAKAGDQAAVVGSQKGGKVINDMTNSMNNQVPQMSGVTTNISNQLSKIDNIKLGGVTKQLAEVNKWLIAVNKAAGPVRSSLNNLCNIPFGNTTRGLSEINRWLNTVKSSASSTRSGLMNLTNLPWGNTTKGLSEVTKWLKNVTTAAKTTENALKAITRVTYGATTKGLSEIKRWLDNVKSGASSARSMLNSLASVRFGGVTSGLSQVNSWLNTVANTAGRTRSALSAVSAARAAVPRMAAEPPQPKMRALAYDVNSNKMDILSSAPDLSAYSLRNTYLNQRSGIESGIANVYQQSIATANQAVSSTLMQALIEQNKMLMQILESDRDIIIHNSVEVDGKQIARSSARYMESELGGIKARRNRFGGVLD